MAGIMNSRDNKGFTLIELLIVIAIIGILGAIAVPMFLGQRTRAMLSEATTNIRIIATANENFYAENGRYAPWPGWPDRSNNTGHDDATYKGVSPATDGAIEFELRGVKFGTEKDLNFKYTLESCDGGQAFLAKAEGKTGSPVAGSILTQNQKNETGDETLTCGP
jgi:prepilin-type N-terminal cleavage/methylation domain-containing protein